MKSDIHNNIFSVNILALFLFALIIIVVSSAGAYFFLIFKPNMYSYTTSVAPFPDVNQQRTFQELRIISVDRNGILLISTSKGKNIRPFTNLPTYGSPTDFPVSPDRNKIILQSSSASLQKQRTFYIFSLDGLLLKTLDEEKIQDILGKQYEINIWGWSRDGKKIVIWARDIKNFLDDRCCEGGDYRVSKQIIAEYDLATGVIKELYAKKAQPLGVVYFDSEKDLLGYTDSEFPTLSTQAYLINLKTGREIAFTPPIQNEEGNGQYFINKIDDVKLSIYSIYSPNQSIAETYLDDTFNKHFGDFIVWSPDNQYFAIGVYNNTPNNHYSIRIYDKNGRLYTNIPVTNIAFYNGRFLFSENNNYLLIYSGSGGPSELYPENWQIVEVNTGKTIENIKSLQIGTPLFFSL